MLHDANSTAFRALVLSLGATLATAIGAQQNDAYVLVREGIHELELDAAGSLLSRLEVVGAAPLALSGLERHRPVVGR